MNCNNIPKLLSSRCTGFICFVFVVLQCSVKFLVDIVICTLLLLFFSNSYMILNIFFYLSLTSSLSNNLAKEMMP